MDQEFNRQYGIYCHWLDTTRDQYKKLEEFTTAYLQNLTKVNKLPNYKVSNIAAYAHFLQQGQHNYKTWIITKCIA